MKQENKPYVTIFTPTYNRAYCLSNLYNSLKKQTSKDFEWIIVDDGSTDDTEQLVISIKQENGGTFSIKYVKKENEGKHIAINVGAQIAMGKLFFIVDSDDMLSDDAVETIISIEKDISLLKGFAGIAGLKGTPEGMPIKSPTELYKDSELVEMLGNFIDATSIEYRYKYDIQGDRAEVVYTDIIRDIPFPKIENDKFMEESYLWNTISKMGLKFRWFNEVIYRCEYLEDGLTSNMKEIVKRNWRTHCFCANYNLTIKEIPIKNRVIFCLRYYRYGLYGKKRVRSLLKECNDKILSIPALLIAICYKVK